MGLFKTLLFAVPFFIANATLGQEKESFKSNLADLGDIKIQYMDFGGNGIPLIWVQDFHNYFEGVYQDSTYYSFFEELTEEYRVLAPIRRGYGQSTDTPWGYDVGTQANDLVRFLNSIGIEKAIFYGRTAATQDMIWIAEHHPEIVMGMIFDGNPVLIADCYDPEILKFMESWMLLASDFEKEKQKTIIMSRLPWRPQFLQDSGFLFQIPALRLMDSTYNWPNPNLGVLESGFLQEYIKMKIEGREDEVDYLTGLVLDSTRMENLRKKLIECDCSDSIEIGMKQAFGDYLITKHPNQEDKNQDIISSHLSWIIPHIKSFKTEVQK